MKIMEKSTGRVFIQDGGWMNYNRDWNNDGDIYGMTVGFFNAEEPHTKRLNRIELTPSEIGPDEDFVEIK